jgi:hypothetical protein
MVLAETVTAIPAFGGGPLRYSAGLAVGRAVNRVAVLVGIAAMLDQLGFIRLTTCLRRFGVGWWAGEGGEQQQDGAVHDGNFRAMANHDIQVLSCANFDSAAFHLYATSKPG